MRKTIAMFLCLLLLCGCFAFSAVAEDDVVACKTAADLMRFVIVDRQYTVPIRVVPAKLETEGATRDVYLISMLGMKDVEGQVNSSRGGTGGTGPYAALVKEIVLETIPKGAALVFAGHSLGGMTAQYLRKDEELKNQYEILNVLCAGSPLMEVSGEAEGSLHRLADIFDVIPFFAGSAWLHLCRQIRTAHRENGGYFFNPDGAHNDSYLRNDVWGGYDCFGEKGGDAVITFSPSQVQYYGAAA